MSSRGQERSTRPPGRPAEEIKRPKSIAVKGGMVRCYHRNCHHTDGPYLTRADTVKAAIHHHDTTHRKITNG